MLLTRVELGAQQKRRAAAASDTIRFNRECQGSRSDRGAAVSEARSCRTPALIELVGRKVWAGNIFIEKICDF
jgi:hypothetical protein